MQREAADDLLQMSHNETGESCLKFIFGEIGKEDCLVLIKNNKKQGGDLFYHFAGFMLLWQESLVLLKL